MVNGDKNHKSEIPEETEEEPDFSDAEGYVDNIEESGICSANELIVFLFGIEVEELMFSVDFKD